MQFKYIVRDSILDLTKMGPKFFAQGLLSLKRSTVLKQIDIPGVGAVNIRPGDSDFATFRQVFSHQDYEIVIKDLADRVRDRYDAILSSGKRPVIVDAGANVGAASLWFQRKYPEAAVIAVEPDPANVELLRKNVAGKDIYVLDAAIGSEEGFVSLHNDGDSWAVQTARANSGLRIVTVDTALSSVTNGELFIVKVDIEGFESDLFASNTNWIDRAFAVYVEPHDWLFPGKRTSRSFQREMSKRDFELLLRGENLIYVR